MISNSDICEIATGCVSAGDSPEQIRQMPVACVQGKDLPTPWFRLYEKCMELMVIPEDKNFKSDVCFTLCGSWDKENGRGIMKICYLLSC